MTHPPRPPYPAAGHGLAPSSTAYYNRTEIQQVHRQIFHASVEATTRTVPPETLTTADVAHIKAFNDTCILF